jgi:hypothetical protein
MLTRLNEISPLIDATWQAAVDGLAKPNVVAGQGGRPELLWDNGARVYTDAFGTPITEGTPPTGVDPMSRKGRRHDDEPAAKQVAHPVSHAKGH